MNISIKCQAKILDENTKYCGLDCNLRDKRYVMCTAFNEPLHSEYTNYKKVVDDGYLTLRCKQCIESEIK